MRNRFLESQAELYYEVWPKKGYRKDAIASVVKAMQKQSIDIIAGRLQEFLDLIKGWDGDVMYIPNLKNFTNKYLNLSHGGWNEQVKAWRGIYKSDKGRRHSGRRRPSGDTNFESDEPTRLGGSVEREDNPF